MATESQNDYICTKCGCEIGIVKEPTSGSGYYRSETRCPVCWSTTKSVMVVRSSIKPRITPESVIKKFAVRDYSDERKIRERFRHGMNIVHKIVRSGVLGDTTVYSAGAEYGGELYVVTKRDGFWTCNCPDHVFRHLPCKHIIAAMLWEEKKGIDPFK